MSTLSMNNRPRLNTSDERLQQIAADLSQNPLNRTKFVSDPVAYLNDQGMGVSAANFVIGEIPNRTSEACTLFFVCAAAAFAATLAVAVQSVAAGFYYAVAAAVYYAYATQTAVYTTGALDTNPSNLAYHNVGGHLL